MASNSLTLIDELIAFLEYYNWRISNRSNWNGNDYCFLVVYRIIDILSLQNDKKREFIINLQNINIDSDITGTIRDKIKLLSSHTEPAVYEYITNHHQFLFTFLKCLHNLNIQCCSNISDKKLLIDYIMINKININAFKNTNKNKFIQELVDNCNLSKLTAKKLYQEISNEINKEIHKEIASKFILETNSTDRIVYSFGLKYFYQPWRRRFANNEQNVFIQPHYDNLKDEVINCNGKVLFSIDRWDIQMQIAINNRQKDECKQYCITTRNFIAYNIRSNTLISIEHLIAVQLYCNTRIEQRRLAESYRLVRYEEGNSEIIDNETIDDIAASHKYFAHWGRLLHESVNVFGNRSWKNEYFYHGVDQEMLFTKTIFVHIYCPLSTTLDKNIAIDNFTGDSGMVIKLDSTMNNAFDCQWISDFPEEKEFLFIGSPNPFRIVNVWICRESWFSLEKYIKAINNIIISETNDENEIELIQNKLLTLKNEISNLSLDQLHNNLDKFAYKIIDEKDKDNIHHLSAISWVVRMFHCYLNQAP